MGIPMRLIRSFFLFLSVILLGAGCGSGRKSGEGAGEAFRIEYARHYRVEHFRDYTLVDVLSPWDSLRLLRRYVLVDRERPLPVGLPEGNIVRTPLQRVVVYSAVHCGMLDELGVGDRIVGVCEPRYIDLDFIRDGVARGAIADLGEASSPDVEKVIDLAPDIIIASPFKNVGYGRIEKTAIPIMECVDYMEVTPLGRAEWMRFMALFFDRGQRADSLFRQTAAAYDSLCRMTDTLGVRPYCRRKNTDRHGMCPGAAVTLPTCTAMPGPITSGPTTRLPVRCRWRSRRCSKRDREPISGLLNTMRRRN